MIYVFEVHVRPGYSAEQYADAWVATSKRIQTAAGARGTRLHRKVDDPNVLLAIASWDSKAARDDMAAQGDEEIAALIRAQSAFVDVRLVGEFGDPEWEVLPPPER